MTIKEKEKFLIKLSKKPSDFGKVITRLMHEKQLLTLEIESLIIDSYLLDPEISRTSIEDLWTKLHRGIEQLDIHLKLDLDCKKSPYGLHALSNGHKHHVYCAWCDKKLKE